LLVVQGEEEEVERRRRRQGEQGAVGEEVRREWRGKGGGGIEV